MTEWKDLPFEIRQKIFDYVPNGIERNSRT